MASRSSGVSRSTKRYICSRQVQKESVSVPRFSVRPAMARWKAWLCRLGRPGTATPWIRSAGPAPAVSIPVIVPCSTTSTTSCRQPPGRSAVSRCNLLAMRWLVRYPTAPVEGGNYMKFYGLVAAAASLIAAPLIAAPAMAQQLAPSETLDAVKARGHVECGVHLGLPGFSFANDKGEWSGLDVDYCKSLAAAVLGDATKVKYTPTSVQ